MINSKILFAAAALALAGLGACSAQSSNAQAPAAIEQTVEAASLVDGAFEGRSDHITTGTASITGTEGNYTLVLSADFELDGAPDPIIGFGKDNVFDIATKIGALSNRTGAQSYALPANFNPDANSEVYIWCEKFSVPLGVAQLN